MTQATTQSPPVKTAFITGAAKRVGRQIAHTLHEAGYRLVIHYGHSKEDAHTLQQSLNAIRSDSVKLVQGDITNMTELRRIADEARAAWGHLDLLVNNASSFYPTPTTDVTDDHWNDLMGTNVKAPYFLSVWLADTLSANQGAIINIVDIHAERPLAGHSVYCMAKAGLQMMTKSLSVELAPTIRVNGIAPGAILWPERPLAEQEKQEILGQIALGKLGTTEDIARTVKFLADDAPYITGQIIAVDGGRSLKGANHA